MFSNIIEMFVCSGLFMLLYLGIISRKANYGFCRRYLIVTVIASALIPMLDVPVSFLHEKPETVMTVPQPVEEVSFAAPEAIAVTPVAMPVTESVVTPAPAVATEEMPSVSTPVNVWLLIYLGVTLALLLYVAIGVISIVILRRDAVLTKSDDYCLAESDQIKSPFTFLRTIFLGRGYNGIERKQILSHEASHVRHSHSYEKLLMSVLRSFFWFNPFVWLAEKSLDEVQEWQADNDALSFGYDLDTYRKTIIRQLFGLNPVPASGLKNSFTKKRLMRMTQKEFWNHTSLLTCSTAVICGVLFVCFGCRPVPDVPAEVLPENNNSLVFSVDTLVIHGSYTAEDGSKVQDIQVVAGQGGWSSSETRRNGNNEWSIDMMDSPIGECYSGYPVSIAIQGYKVAYSVNSPKLWWVNEKTNIYIGHKKASLAEFRALKDGSFKTIFYLRKVNDPIVFVSLDDIDHSIHNFQTLIDLPSDSRNQEKLGLPDIMSMGSYQVYDVFLLQYKAIPANIYMPESRFAVEGELVSYDKFKQAYQTEAHRITVYKNDEARKRFGEDVKEVVDMNSRSDEDNDSVIHVSGPVASWAERERFWNYIQENDCAGFQVDRFFDGPIEGMTGRISLKESKSRHIDIYENSNGTVPVTTVAAKGYKCTDSPRSSKLKWVSSNTNIFIGGKRSTLEEFLALKRSDYIGIIFYRSSADSNPDLSFVYVVTELNSISAYDTDIAIYSDKMGLPDHVEPGLEGFRNTFFNFHSRVAAGDTYVMLPDARFRINGTEYPYSEFYKIMYPSYNHSMDIYFGKEADSRLPGAEQLVEVSIR